MARDLDVVRHELCSRIAALDRRAAQARPAELATAVDEIRAIAIAADLHAATTVIRFVRAALAAGERGPRLADWLRMLGDAVGCERHDVTACDAFAAACSIRLAG